MKKVRDSITPSPALKKMIVHNKGNFYLIYIKIIKQPDRSQSLQKNASQHQGAAALSPKGGKVGMRRTAAVLEHHSHVLR